MHKQLLLIDGQVFQTAARDRGMGRYSARLVQSIIAQGKYEKVQMILTKGFQTNRLHLSEAENMFPGVEFVLLNLLTTEKESYERTTEHNARELNHYIENCDIQREQIDFLVPSPFQEPIVSVYPDGVQGAVVFYDLIPYLYHHRYEPLMPFENYLKRFTLLTKAHRILTISQSVKDDLMVYLGIPGERLFVIDGAPIKSLTSPQKPASFNVPSKYVLMPTSDDPRKNNLRAVLGFEEARAILQADYKLIITSKIHKNEQNRLSVFSNNIIFTGNLPESELDWLYENCHAVLFVPESEGLGLPILEAMQVGKKIVCSSLNVFKEISKSALHYCDYENQHSIAATLAAALLDTAPVDLDEYHRALEHYSWERTGIRAAEALAAPVSPSYTSNRLRIAIFTPRPDGLSAVGKVVAESYPKMSEYFDIDYYVEGGRTDYRARPNYLKYIAPCYPAESFDVEEYTKYDAVIYHIGNSDYHIESISKSLYLPGYVVMHDTNISEAYRIMTESGMISEQRVALEKKLDKELGVKMSTCIGSVVTRQLGVMTHSLYAKHAIEEAVGGEEVACEATCLATLAPSMVRDRDYRQPVVGLAGIIADIKGLKVIEAIATSSHLSSVQIKLFGYNFAHKGALDALEAHPHVSVSTNLTDFDFQNSMSKLDIFVNYRMKYQGETSLSTLEAMRQGVVVIVRDIGWYAELPDDVVIKVDSEEEVLSKLTELLDNPSQMAEIAGRAREYIINECTYENYSRSLLSLIGKSQELKSLPAKIAHELRLRNVTSKQQMLALVKRLENSNDNLD